MADEQAVKLQEEQQEEEEEQLQAPEPIDVKYCPVCTLPYEYCEFSLTKKKCYTQLKENDAALFEKLHGGVNMDNVADKKKGQPSGKKAVKLDASPKIVVTRIQRTKKKFATNIAGLNSFGHDLKKAAKTISGRFAASGSVVGDDEVQVTGDVTVDIVDFLKDKFKIEPEDVKIVDKKKKKKQPT